MRRLELALNQETRRSEINVGRGIRLNLAALISPSLPKEPRRIGIISNDRVFQLYGRAVVRTLKREGFKVFTWLMPEGERHKSFRALENAVKFLNDNNFERDDLVVALGGGVVGDLAGFAAAIYLRGLPLAQMPTTLLSQIDSSVGGKTAINLPSGKNLVGAFHQPACVVIDTETLMSLPPRELVSGFCEMVKQSLIADKSLFEQTVARLRQVRHSRQFLLTSDFEDLIAAQCGFKASIVANDERESTDRSDAKSRRILNFGHTTAHALEAVTNYRVFRHGEAVGYGMLVAGELSRNLGLLDPGELELLREAVQLCGPLPRADNLDLNQIIRALKHDKKSVAGQINWVLLEGVGSPKIVEGKLISAKSLRLSLRAGLQQARDGRKVQVMRKSSERGSGRLQFLIVMTVIVAAAYAGYLYIPVSFRAHAYKDLMQHYANVAATQGYEPSWVSQQLLKSAAEHDVPPNAVVTPLRRDERVEVRVQYVKPIEFPGYTYNYEFDHTVKSTAFLVVK